MSISAGFCDLRQVVQRRGTRAEARAIIEDLAETVYAEIEKARSESEQGLRINAAIDDLYRLAGGDLVGGQDSVRIRKAASAIADRLKG